MTSENDNGFRAWIDVLRDSLTISNLVADRSGTIKQQHHLFGIQTGSVHVLKIVPYERAMEWDKQQNGVVERCQTTCDYAPIMDKAWWDQKGEWVRVSSIDEAESIFIEKVLTNVLEPDTTSDHIEKTWNRAANYLIRLNRQGANTRMLNPVWREKIENVCWNEERGHGGDFFRSYFFGYLDERIPPDRCIVLWRGTGQHIAPAFLVTNIFRKNDDLALYIRDDWRNYACAVDISMFQGMIS
jgi:hypothetical protein